MMRWNDFGRSVIFAAVAAAGFVPFSIAATPWLGWQGVVIAYAIATATTYLIGAGPTRSQGLLAGVALGLGATVVAIASPSAAVTVAAVAIGMGALRSGLLYRSRFARAAVVEAALAGFGLAIAARLFDGSTFSVVLAVWAFYLAQSAFFLVGGVAPRSHAEAAVDPFDAAHARAIAVLEATDSGEAR
jgi:hypothetical protein